MVSNLPEELFLEILQFLTFADLGRINCVCKGMPKEPIYYRTYTRETDYDGKIAISYLLTNGPEELPAQIKNNYVEIKLLRYTTQYYFVLYKSIYRTEKDIFSYLHSIDQKNTKKTIFNLVSGYVKIIPDFPLK